MNYKKSWKLSLEFQNESHALVEKYLKMGVNESDIIKQIEILKILPMSEIFKQHLSVSTKPIFKR